MYYLIILCMAFSSLLTAQEPLSKKQKIEEMITLQSNDGISFTLSQKACNYSDTLKVDIDNEFTEKKTNIRQFTKINSNALKTVCALLTAFEQQEIEPVRNALTDVIAINVDENNEMSGSNILDFFHINQAGVQRLVVAFFEDAHKYSENVDSLQEMFNKFPENIKKRDQVHAFSCECVG